MVSAPKAPDPVTTAQAQAGMNRDTAITQQQLNMVNQLGPTGSLTYNQTGTSRFKDSQGKWVETPTYTATTKLSPEQQKIFDQTQAASLNLGTIANERSNFLKDYLAKPFEVNSATEQKLYDLGASRLDPRFAQQKAQLESQLTARGIRPGSTAYTSAMNDFEQGRNDAYNSLALSGRQQAFQEASYERAQPLNEIGALLSGSQVQQYQPISTPQTGVGGVDYTGLVNNKYQADSQRAAAGMGGLFGLLAAPFSLSDERAKEDIKRIGTTTAGIPIYTYRYKGSPTTHMGVMAQDLLAVNPDAVAVHDNGLYVVDYSKVN